MKSSQKGFVVPILITIIVVLVIGGGFYIYNQNNVQSLLQKDISNNEQESTEKNSINVSKNEPVIKLVHQYDNDAMNEITTDPTAPVTVSGDNLFMCNNPRDCETLVYIGNKSFSITDIRPDGYALSFSPSKMDNGDYDLYLYNPINKIKSNTVKVKISNVNSMQEKFFRLYRRFDSYIYLMGEDGTYYKSTEVKKFVDTKNFVEGDTLSIKASSYAQIVPPEKYYYGIKDYSVDITELINNIAIVKRVTESNFKFLTKYDGSTYSLSYPSDFAFVDNLTPEGQKKLGSYMAACPLKTSYRDPNETGFCYTGGLTSDGFSVAALDLISSSTMSIQDCQKTQQNNNGQSTKITLINNISYYQDSLSDAGLGHYLDIDSYRTYHNGVCYTISLKVESNRGVSEKGLSSDFSNMMKNKLKNILATFTFTK